MENTGDLSIHGAGVSTFKLLLRPSMKNICHSNCQIHLDMRLKDFNEAPVERNKVIPLLICQRKKKFET